jgi:uncharacterized membrane protein
MDLLLAIGVVVVIVGLILEGLAAVTRPLRRGSSVRQR